MRKARSSLLYSIYGFILVLFTLSTLHQGCVSEQEKEKRQQFAKGKMLYEKHCQRCHKADGEGFEQLYPPLNEVNWLKRHKGKVPCIIQHGMKGPIKVGGEIYNQPMPGVQDLTAYEITHLMTYMYNAWDNSHKPFQEDWVSKKLNGCDSTVEMSHTRQ